MTTQAQTLTQYDAAFTHCRDIFSVKIRDYGSSWRVLRSSSLTDQLYIKAQRIRTLEQGRDKGIVQRVLDGVDEEFRAIVNYAIIALIQMELGYGEPTSLSSEEALVHYDRRRDEIRELMRAKNHDYGEAWRDMRISSFTDMILMKLMRVKQIEENLGETLISEGIESHYSDMANYALFALIKLEEKDEV